MKNVFNGTLKPLWLDIEPIEKQEYVGNMCSPIALWHGKVRREDFTRLNQLEFEGRFYSVQGNYVEYLEPLYGKNCTTELPPPEKRASGHTLEIYRCVKP